MNTESASIRQYIVAADADAAAAVEAVSVCPVPRYDRMNQLCSHTIIIIIISTGPAL